MSLRFKIMPRYVDGADQAPETARKTDKVYIQHEEFTEGKDGIVFVDGAEESEVDALLDDPKAIVVADKVLLVDELLAAVLEDGGIE